jgi:hypothetical protein
MKKSLFLFILVNPICNFNGIGNIHLNLQQRIQLQLEIQRQEKNALKRAVVFQNNRNKKLHDDKISFKQNADLKNNQFGNPYRNR